MMNLQRKMRARRYGGSRRGWPLVKYGIIWFAIGLLITIGTYAFAASRGGGTYLVSYGPMIVGLICIARGGIDMARQRRSAGSVMGPADTQAYAGAPGQGQAYAGAPGQGQAYAGQRQAYAATAGQGYSDPGYRTQAQAMTGGGMPGHGGYSQASAAPQPNWYPDPGNPAMLRWWDGQMWTNHTRPFN